MANIVILSGRLGKDPATTTLPTGKVKCEFSLATTSGESTDWHNIVAWEKTAGLCQQYLRKGKLALIRGRITQRSWDKDGQKHYKTEIVADSVEFLSPKEEGEAALGTPAYGQAQQPPPPSFAPPPFAPAPGTPAWQPPPMDEDIPF